MIYVSSSCVRATRIADSVKILAEAGFRAIELSGGTDYYPEIETDLLRLQDRYGLSFLCHNYFPPPAEHFVVNLASLNDDIYEKSVRHLCENLRLSKVLGADRISFHAGFLVDITISEIGRDLSRANMTDGDAAMARFVKGYALLRDKAGELPVYIENNVYSWTNRQTYGPKSPFMLVCHEDFQRLKEQVDFHFLLDVGHLQVSCHSMGLDFADQLKRLFPHADYLHLSDNDAMRDAHGPLREEGPLFAKLLGLDFAGKLISLEVCADIDEICRSHESVQVFMAKGQAHRRHYGSFRTEM